MIDRIGGRKFFLTLICIAVGTTVELQHGMSTAYAGLLAALVTAFGAANAWNTQQFLATQTSDSDAEPQPADTSKTDDLQNQIGTLRDQVEAVSTTLSAADRVLAQVSLQAQNAQKMANAALKVNGGGQP